jgi:hypothetical protein
MRLVLMLLAALLMAGCTYEVRGNEIWACGTVQLLDGQTVYACQPTGWRVP